MVEHVKAGAVTSGAERAGASVQSIDERFNVELGARLPSYDSPHAKAYSARDAKDPSAALFTLVVEPGIAWRGSVLVAQQAINHPSMMQVRAIGPIALPDTARRQAAIVFDRPHGARLSTRRGTLKEDILLGVVLPQLLDGLQALHAHHVIHRALRSDNLFFLNDREDAIVIGDGVTAPPGYDQPADFEIIERATASPQGRGEGTPACELFALGVTLARLVDATDPPEMDPVERVIARVAYGSFGVIAGTVKCSVPLRGLIAALMADDPAQRPTIEAVRNWIANAGAVPLPVVRVQPEARPYAFLGQNSGRPNVISRLFAHHIEEAREEIRKGHLSRWVRSGLGQVTLADEIEKLVGRPEELVFKQRPVDFDAINRICCLLDPTGPIIHRGLSIMPDGFAGALSQAALANDDEALEIITGMVNLGLPMAALGSPLAVDKSEDLKAIHNKLQGTLRWKKADSGVERVIYEFDHELPCLSLLTLDQLPIGPAHYLQALDGRVQMGESFALSPLDRYGKAYIAARLSAGLQKKARDLRQNLRNRVGDVASDLPMLSIAQEKFGAGPMPDLASWPGKRLTAAFDGVHNKERRGRLVASLKATAQADNLSAVLSLLVDQREIHADNEEYRRALERYDALGGQLEALNNNRRRRGPVANLVGRQMTAAIAALVFTGASLVSILGALR